MINIQLIRHAKSDWNYSDLIDFQRPLNHRGLSDCTYMHQEISLRKDSIWHSSSAHRTYQTSTLLAKKLDFPLNFIQFSGSLYHASQEKMLEYINQIKSPSKNLILVGHNNGISDLANLLTNDYQYSLPTLGILEIEIELDSFEEISPATGIAKKFVYPKMFKD